MLKTCKYNPDGQTIEEAGEIAKAERKSRRSALKRYEITQYLKHAKRAELKEKRAKAQKRKSNKRGCRATTRQSKSCRIAARIKHEGKWYCTRHYRMIEPT